MNGKPVPRRDRFDTLLSERNEMSFRGWVTRRSKELGRDMAEDLSDYDLRGYWLAGGWADQGAGHGPDRFKKPNHPTFSTESVYHGAAKPGGGTYEGGTWSEDSFTPSEQMVSEPGRWEKLQQYMKTTEPEVKLFYPLARSH